MDGIEIHRTHVIELARELGDDLLEIRLAGWRGDLLRALRGQRRRRSSTLHWTASLRDYAQGFLEGKRVAGELTQVDLIPAHHMLDQVPDAQLQLGLADFFLAARVAQII